MQIAALSVDDVARIEKAYVKGTDTPVYMAQGKKSAARAESFFIVNDEVMTVLSFHVRLVRKALLLGDSGTRAKKTVCNNTRA